MSPISKLCDAGYVLLYKHWTIDYLSNVAWVTSTIVVFLVLTTAITVGSLWWWWWWWCWSSSKRPPLPPGPRGLPIIGNLPFIGTELHRNFAKFAEIYGPIMKLQLGGKLCIVLTSPSLAKEVFKDHDTIFANHDVVAVASIATYGCIDIAFSPYGDHWRMLRKLCVSELLNQRRLGALYGLRRKEIHHMVSQLYLEAGSPIDIGERIFLTTFNVITSMLWGDTLTGEEGRHTTVEIRRAMHKIVTLLGEHNISDLFPALAWLDIQGIGRRMKKEISWLDQILDSVVNERIKTNQEKKRGSNEDDKQANDLLQALLQQLSVNLQSKEGSTPGLTISHIKALFFDVMVAGTESVSGTVEWAMAELLKHPHIMKKAKEELEEVVGLNNMVEESHLPKLLYLNGVVKEVLRLHIPGPFLVPRCPSESCTIGGFAVPKGSKVMVNAWAIHRDPLVWENPLEFQPERFLRSGDDFSGKDFQYIPFGSGRRICVGIPIVERMLPYLLATILHSFQWKLPNGAVEELDMSDKFGLQLKKATPLVAIPSPRLSDLTLYN